MGIKLGKMTFGSLFKKPETILYPIEKKEPPLGLKGTVVNTLDTCILCSICAKVCPCSAIIVDKPGRMWKINRYQCVQCGSCIRECPKKCLEMNPKAPLAVGSFDFDSYPVPEQEKKPKAKKADQQPSAIEPTGDPEMDAKLASMDPAKAAKLRAAFMAKKAKEQGEQQPSAIEPTGDPEMDAKLASMDPAKAAKLRAAFMAKKAKEQGDKA